MLQPFAALEFDRVLKVVALFTRSNWGKQAALKILPRFAPGEGSSAFRLAREVQQLKAKALTLPFAGLDAADLLADPTASPGPEELLQLIGLVRCVCDSRRALAAEAQEASELARVAAALPSLEGLLAYCEHRLSPDGTVPNSASPELAHARKTQERSRHAIIASLEQLRRHHQQLTAPYTLRRDRYCIPVPLNDRGSLPGLVLDLSATGATAFMEPFEVVSLNNALAEAQARAREEEERVLQEVTSALSRHRDDLLRAARLLAEIDAVQACILFGEASGGVILEPGAGKHLRLLAARHPLLDPSLARLRGEALGETGNNKPVVPLTLELRDDARVVLLSGPNAGGKTVALKTLGLAALMAQAGIPVLADQSSQLPPFSGVWCHVGDEQDLFSELSTFTAAMRATAGLLANADAATLVLYDELGSGTDPEEGAALAAALLEAISARGCWTLCTAHLVTVAAHLDSIPGSVNACMGFDEDAGCPTYRLEMGAPGRSHGLAIASQCGVPQSVLERARELLSRAFLALDTHLERLEQERERLERERASLGRSLAAAQEARDRANEARERLEGERQALRVSLGEERERLRRAAQERLRSALEELDQARLRGEMPGKKRQASIRRTALEFGDEEPEHPPASFTPGAGARLRGSRAVGKVKSVVGDRLEVILGSKRVWVPTNACELVAPPTSDTPGGSVSVPDRDDAASELRLLGLSQEEAREELERFLDRALLAGTRRVRIVHGHGSGVLRRVVKEVLSSHAAVSSFAHPPQYRGGSGATEAELE